MYSHVACDVMKERTLYLLKPSSLIWHLMPYLFLSIYFHNVCMREVKAHICGGSNSSRLAFAIKFINS